MLKLIAAVFAAGALLFGQAAAQTRPAPPVLVRETSDFPPVASARLETLAGLMDRAGAADPDLTARLEAIQAAVARRDVEGAVAAFAEARPAVARRKQALSALLAEIKALPPLPDGAATPEVLAILTQSQRLVESAAGETLAMLASIETLAAEFESGRARNITRVSLAMMQNGLSSLRRVAELLELQTLQTEALLGPDPAALVPVAAAQALAAAMQAEFEAVTQQGFGPDPALETLAAADALAGKRLAEAQTTLREDAARARAFVEALPEAERTALLTANLTAFATTIETRLSAAELMHQAVAGAHSGLRSGRPARDVYLELAGRFQAAAPVFDRATHAYFRARQELAIEFERYR